MTAEIHLSIRGDPELSLESDAVEMTRGGTDDYEELQNKPSLNGTTLVGALTSEDVGITAANLGVTAESLGITPESVAENITADDLGITPESMGISTAGTAKVLATIFGD